MKQTIPNFTIRQAQPEDAERMQASFAQIGWSKPAGYFATCCQQQDAGQLVLLIAEDEGSYVGHCKIVWEPTYPHFKEHGIPEVQDLNVLGAYRRQGAASRLMDEAERRIGERSAVAGIGFGLYRDYGAAQRMYVLRGYVPDGRGIAYRDAYVEPGQSYPVDDDLVLGLVKRLRG
ncbi:MAG: GNAT family N-acetyltransferase [Caldilineaceae bacterium]